MGRNLRDVLKELDSGPTTIGEMVRSFRKTQGFTLKILSEITSIPETHLSQIENDRIDLGVKRAEVLAAAFGVRPQDILFPEGIWEKTKELKEIEKKAKKAVASL